MNIFTGGNDPKVVIVGRPNVGKSSLFNCLLQRRIAIVDARPGVTRDRLSAPVHWADRRWTLIDTGGLEDTATVRKLSATANAIRLQVTAALAEAQLALLVVDAKSGVTGLDEAIARYLRRRGMPTLLVVNKCDTEKTEWSAFEFNRLGWSGLPVSAAHARGIDALLDAVENHLRQSAGTPPPGTETHAPKAATRLAVVGRPNVGKSSLINAFLREERVLVSAEPGTTRDSVDVALEIPDRQEGTMPFIITDTAGLRRTREMESPVEAFSIGKAENAVRHCDIAALVLEAGKGPTARDKKIASLISEYQRAALVLVNKTDLVETKEISDYRQEIKLRLPFMDHCPVCFLSARLGANLPQALACVVRLAKRLDIRLSTGTLNRIFEKALQRVQPPRVRSARLKVFYVTQIGNRPLRIALFVNDPERMTPAYQQFLAHEIRRRFRQLEGLPIVFELRKRH